MDVKAALKARNLDDAQIETLMTNPAHAGILESLMKEAEDGKTAYMNAQKIESDLKTWNENQVVPYVREADEKVAKTQAKLSAMETHMKTLKERGYDIPDAYFDAAPPVVAPKSEPSFDPKVFDERAMDIAKTNMALVSLSNRHRKLTGDELDLETEYSDFEKNKRPQENLRTYIARKYDHDGKQSALSAAAEQKKLDDYASEKLKVAKAEWTQANGVNPETRIPKSSRWDAIKGEDEDRSKDWQTAAGRERATQQRLAKYTTLVQ